MGGSVFGQIQVGFRQAGTSVDSASGAAPVWGGPCTVWGSPGTGSYAGALPGAALPPWLRCLPRRAPAAPVEARRERRVEECQGEAANLIAELKGFAPTALSGLRAMSGRTFPSPACSCPSRSATREIRPVRSSLGSPVPGVSALPLPLVPRNVSLSVPRNISLSLRAGVKRRGSL